MNLLITGAWNDATKHITEIESMGHKVVFLQQEKDLLPCPYDWVEGVICNGLFLYHPISAFINLRYIQLTSAGYDRVPMQEIQRRDIEIHNARDVYSIPMAEFAIAGVLDIYKGMGQFREQQKRHEWIKNRNLRELAGSTVVIIGCGSVGTECAKRFKAFGCRVIGIDLILRDDECYDQIKGMAALDEELAKADVIVLTLPLTDETKDLINQRRLDLIQGILVNISRGAVVDQTALENWNGIAVLDVFSEEPLDTNSHFWDNSNMIITPHNSFVGTGNSERLTNVVLNGLIHKAKN